jgi:hypothetical protein
MPPVSTNTTKTNKFDTLNTSNNKKKFANKTMTRSFSNGQFMKPVRKEQESNIGNNIESDELSRT